MKKVIVLGSLNMDLSICCDTMPQAGETLNGYDFFINPGGKGGNQAVAAAKLGANTHMIANVGNDLFGKQLRSTLQEYGVHDEYVMQQEEVASGVALIVCCEEDNRIILGNGANHTLSLLKVQNAIDQLASPKDIFLTQLENDFETVKQSLIYAKQKGLYTILNPAPARMLDHTIYEHLDLLIVNQSECALLSSIYPKDDKDCEAAIAYFEKQGVQVIITLGEDGSITKENNKMIKIKSRKVKAIDTTAAGDSYIGALCMQLAQGNKMKEALRFASDVAALCVTRRGAQVAIPYYQEVIDIYKEEYTNE